MYGRTYGKRSVCLCVGFRGGGGGYLINVLLYIHFVMLTPMANVAGK